MREINKSTISDGNFDSYLINEEKEKVIKIPAKVLKTIGSKLKFNSSDAIKSLLASDMIYAAIHLKATDQEVFARKFLTFGLTSEPFQEYLTFDEVKALVDFLMDVPSGYLFTENNRPHAHNEARTIKF